MDNDKSVHHIVLFELPDTTTDEAIASIIEDGVALLSQIPGVINVELGLKAREDRDVHIKNYQLGLYVHLASDGDLDVYAPHPHHQEFLARHRTKWTKVQVLDFFGK